MRAYHSFIIGGRLFLSMPALSPVPLADEFRCWCSALVKQGFLSPELRFQVEEVFGYHNQGAGAAAA